MHPLAPWEWPAARRARAAGTAQRPWVCHPRHPLRATPLNARGCVTPVIERRLAAYPLAECPQSKPCHFRYEGSPRLRAGSARSTCRAELPNGSHTLMTCGKSWSPFRKFRFAIVRSTSRRPHWLYRTEGRPLFVGTREKGPDIHLRIAVPTSRGADSHLRIAILEVAGRHAITESPVANDANQRRALQRQRVGMIQRSISLRVLFSFLRHE